MACVGRRLLYLSAFLWMIALMSPLVTPAFAEINGNCSATFKGVSVAGLSSTSAGDAIDVDDNEQVVVSFTSPVGFTSHDVDLEIAGISRNIDSDEDGGDTEWSSTVNVNDYAWLGAGLYKVTGTATLSDGTTCSGAALINVTRNPLTTVVGGIAAAGTAAGVAGVGVSSVVSARNGVRGGRNVEDWIVNEIEKVDSPSAGTPPPDALSEEQAWIETADLFFSPLVGRIPCSILILPALLFTGASMAMPQGSAPAPKGLRLRRVGWLPRFTVAGVLGGLLAGILIPSLIHLWSVMHINSAISSGEQRLGAALAKSGPGGAPPPAGTES